MNRWVRGLTLTKASAFHMFQSAFTQGLRATVQVETTVERERRLRKDGTVRSEKEVRNRKWSVSVGKKSGMKEEEGGGGGGVLEEGEEVEEG